MNNLNRNVLKYVVKKMKEMKIPSDKIVVQKLMFYLKESIIPISYDYEMYAYGPYSKKLNSDAEYLEFEKQLSIVDYKYGVGEKYKNELSEKYKKIIYEKIDKFSTLLDNRFDFNSIEIFGTTLYCYNALKRIGIDPNLENVTDEFKAWKGEKYGDDLIKNFYRKIVEGLAE